MSRKTAFGDAPDMTVQDVAEYLGVSSHTVRNMISDGRLRAYTLGPRILRLRCSEVDAALKLATADDTPTITKGVTRR
jgi:excisionase family DNA binding protein